MSTVARSAKVDLKPTFGPDPPTLARTASTQPALKKQTWRIDTKGISRLAVEFDYKAAVLSANQARIAADYALFTGTQLFLMPEGHRSRPSVLRFDVPTGWKIAGGLDETADPMVFTAPDYDTLVDQPTLTGQFDVTRFWGRRLAARGRRQSPRRVRRRSCAR